MMLIGWQTWLVARTWFWCQRDFAASDSLSRASTIDPKPPIVSFPLIRKRCLTISLRSPRTLRFKPFSQFGLMRGRSCERAYLIFGLSEVDNCHRRERSARSKHSCFEPSMDGTRTRRLRHNQSVHPSRVGCRNLKLRSLTRLGDLSRSAF